MSLDFPVNPTSGQEYTPSMGGQTYIWHSPRWLVKGIPPTFGGISSIGIEEAPMDGKQYGRFNSSWTEILPSYSWSTLPGKPAVFPPESHTHAQVEVVGLTAALSAKETLIVGGTVNQFWRGDKTWQALPVLDWSTITSKPSTFPPSAHGHTQNEITSLVSDLAGKAPTVHSHTQAEVTGLSAALTAKEALIQAGTITQYWRGDKTWQTLPGFNWETIPDKPATFPPSTHFHVIADTTDLQNQLDQKSPVVHTHAYSSLTGIPFSFTPSSHVHAQADVTNLVADLGLKAPKASPSFTGTASFDVINVTGNHVGTTATFSGDVLASDTITVKTISSYGHFWIRGPANEDRMVLYAPGPASGNAVLRVGGTQNFTFGSTGMFTSPAGISTTTGAFSGAITGASTIVAGSGISTTNGHITANDYVYSQAGYFIGAPTLAVIGTTSNSVGTISLRPAGYNVGLYSMTVEGTAGNVTATGSFLSNNARFLGSTNAVFLATRASGGTVYLRPNGDPSATGELRVSSNGAVQINGPLDCNSSITSYQDYKSSTAAVILSPNSTAGTIYFRPVNSTSTEQGYYQYTGNLTIGNQGYKAVAGSWAASSDARIKNVIGDYEIGLKEILQLKVRRYTYKGNETLLAPDGESPHQNAAMTKEEHVSLVAQEAELAMPDLVTRSTAWIDGKKVTDFRTLNPTNVTWALINAVQELTARLEALEVEKSLMPFSGFQDFNPDFSDALQQMIAARPGISVNSGYRTPQRQAELFQGAISKYGSVEAARHHVAPAPGTYGSKGSRHNFGLAADLGFASPKDEAWAHANAANYGLNFRMGHEPWHIELLNGQAVAVQDNGKGNQALPAQYDIPRPPPETPPWQPSRGFQRSPDIQINPNALETQDVQTLSKLLAPKRSSEATELLKRIRNY